MTSVLDRRLGVAPQVSVRPERFGALLYHFGTRRLSFLKDRRLLEVLERLDGSATARAACDGAGVAEEALPAFERALARLVETDMLRERRP
ncbi:MAG: mycofactocin biosynthesis chaperone MftB [bacterium]|nr:mycofactocin biosynthesis chaperone MftB [bacterium]